MQKEDELMRQKVEHKAAMEKLQENLTKQKEDELMRQIVAHEAAMESKTEKHGIEAREMSETA